MPNTTKKVLITVMTYPVPSQKYQELVCTAGITEAGEWVRLYPIEYRYLSPQKKYRKYQWIELELMPRGGKDLRKESFTPNLDTLQPIGQPLSTAHGWRERRQWVDRLPHRTLKEYQALYDSDKTSLGIVRPKRILDFTIERINPEWSEKQSAILSQLRMFEENFSIKELAKIPYKFSYVFECEDSPKPHHAMCEDWELGVLFLKEKQRLGSEESAAQSVKNKFLDEICAPKNDTRFFMGTIYPFNTWVVLGLFYPPNEPFQPSLL
jgi:hypothetical protein